MKRRGQLARDDSNAPVGWNYFYMQTGTTANIANSAGIVHNIIIGKPVNSDTVQLYDGTSTSGATIANLFMYTTLANIYELDVAFANGLYLVTNDSNAQITVTYISGDK